MKSTITCPRCRNEFEVTEVMRTQLTDQIRAEFEAGAAARQAELEAMRIELNNERAEVESARMGLDEQVRAQVATARQHIVAEARQQATDELTVELRDRDQQVAELRQKLKTAQDAELEIRQRERDLQAKSEELQLEVARQLDTEREKVRAEFEAAGVARQAELEAMRIELSDELAEIESVRTGLDDQVRAQVASARQQIATEARQQAVDEVSVELRDRDQPVPDVLQMLRTAQDAELEIRQ